MKILYLMFFVLLFGWMSAQQVDNRFSDSENEGAEPPTQEVQAVTTGTGPPGDDDLPIDDYLPLLAITAVGIIIYTTQKKRNLIRK